MAFERPTLQALIDRVKGDLEGGLGLVTILRRSFLGVIARALAGLAHLLFGYLAWLERQVFLDTTDDIEIIRRWGAIWGVPQKLATFSKFVLDVTGTAATVIPVNTIYRRSDGVEFETDEEVTLTGSGDQLNLTAIEPGAAGTVLVSDQIQILSPIAGLNSTGTVSAITIKPEDDESIESYRQRILDRIRNPPSGGAAHDYIQWALAVPGITRAWVGPQSLGPGTVQVFVVSDGEDPITPIGAKLTEVFDYIEGLRPVTANVTVVSPVLFPIDMTIELRPNLTDVQDAITTELEDLILREAQVPDTYKAPGELFDGKLLLSHINEAIAVGVGEEDHVLDDINGDPPGDLTAATGNLFVLGTITWLPLA